MPHLHFQYLINMKSLHFLIPLPFYFLIDFDFMFWGLTILLVFRQYYKKGALDSQPQVEKLTSCLPMVGGSLRVLRLLPPLKLIAMI
jgi:hypothetical protein